MAAYASVWVTSLVAKGILITAGLRNDVGGAILMVDVAMLVALLPLRRHGLLGMRELGLRRISATQFVRYVATGFVAIACFGTATHMVLPGTGNTDIFGDARDQGFWDIIVTGFAACCVAPIVEEVFFRGVVYRSIRNGLPALVAIPIAGLMFGIIHVSTFPLIALPGKVFFGIVACTLYEYSGSLLPGIFLHCFIDASAFEVAYSGSGSIALGVSCAIMLSAIFTSVVSMMRRRAAE